ncbi:MAG: c-type cytochrome [Gammaproteobacteria bacterium]
MKKLILSAALIAPLAVAAQPSSHVAWTVEQLNLVKSGDAQKGKEHALTCNACHGENGISRTADTPSLAGQLPTYLFKQLQDYADNSRENPIMSGLAKTLSKQDAADLAAWFASLPAPSEQAYGKHENAERLTTKGDNDRRLAPCEICHGANGEGHKMDVPVLAGQQADYLAAALRAYKQGSRHNDVYGKMRMVARLLTDEEIAELGRYYQQMKR